MKSEATIQSPGFDRRAIPPNAVESLWQAPDGQPIRRIDWLARESPARGSILFMPGRADVYEKYLETLDYWNRSGWQVTAADWRGQAYSGRLGSDETTGHIDDFNVWIDDLSAFWHEWKDQSPAPYVLIAHSMGGNVALRALAERRVDPDAMVLSTPMLGFQPAFLPLLLQHGFARLMTRVGDPHRPAWEGDERPEQMPGDRFARITHDHDRYDDESWWRKERPGLAMGPPSWGWLERAAASMRELRRPGLLEAVQTPVLFLSASHDRLVNPRATRRAAARMPHAELVRFGREARHEILREVDPVRERAIAAIDEFLDRTVPVAI